MANLFRIINGVKIRINYVPTLRGSECSYLIDGGGCVCFWDLALVVAEFLSYGLTSGEAFAAACDFFNNPEHERVPMGDGLVIETCQNKGRAEAIKAARVKA